MRLTHMMASAAIMALTATVLPTTARAGGLLDVDATVGGGSLATASTDADIGSLGAHADARLGTATSAHVAVGTTTGTVIGGSVTGSLGKVGSISGVAARAEALDTIHAKALLLGPRNLLKLCVTVGAKGCEGASTSRQVALIDARAAVLSGGDLARACVAVGGGCGRAAAAAPSTGSGSGTGSGTGTAGRGRAVVLRGGRCGHSLQNKIF